MITVSVNGFQHFIHVRRSPAACNLSEDDYLDQQRDSGQNGLMPEITVKEGVTGFFQIRWFVSARRAQIL